MDNPLQCTNTDDCSHGTAIPSNLHALGSTHYTGSKLLCVHTYSVCNIYEIWASQTGYVQVVPHEPVRYK